MDILPESLNWAAWWTLVGGSFFTSFLTAAFGIGGGITLLALMAQFLPAAAIIPIHGVVQAGSNIGRAALLIREVQWTFVGAFSAGALIGGFIGGQMAIALPTAALQLLLGAFILYMVWGPPLPAWSTHDALIALQGVISTVLTMFVGATGPFIAAALKPMDLAPTAYVATFSFAMSLQHILKIIIFLALGFAFNAYIPLMGAMLLTGFVGTWVGTRVLKRINPVVFRKWINIALTLLAIRLIWQAIS